MKLGDLTKADIPFRDRTMRVTNLGDWWGILLGVIVFMIAMGVARPVYDAIAAATYRRLPMYAPAAMPAAEHPGIRVLR